MATQKEVNESIVRLMKICQSILTEKGKGYSGDDVDRLKNFKVASKLSCTYTGRYTNPKRILWGYLLKHITSITYMCCGDKFTRSKCTPSRADWDEKLSDCINYLLLLSAIVDEELREEANDPDLEPRTDSTIAHIRQRKNGTNTLRSQKYLREATTADALAKYVEDTEA